MNNRDLNCLFLDIINKNIEFIDILSKTYNIIIKFLIILIQTEKMNGDEKKKVLIIGIKKLAINMAQREERGELFRNIYKSHYQFSQKIKGLHSHKFK